MYLVYLFLGWAIGAWSPYAGLYLRSMGLADAQVGLLLAVSPLMGLLANPIMGSLADRRGPVRVLKWILPGAALAALAVRGAGGNPWLLAGGLGLLAITLGATFPLTDSIALARIARQGGVYGRMRVWATFGFIISAGLAGYTYQWWGIRLIFVWLPLGLALQLLALRRGFPDGGPLPPQRVRGGGALAVLSSGPWPLALLVVIALQMANTGHGLYFSIYVRELGGGAGLAGLAWAVAALAEVPAMWYLGPVILRVGPLRALSAAALVYSVRYLLLAAAATPMAALATQLLHGLSFGIAGQALVLLAAELAPPDLQATAQGLMAGAGYGVAAVVGSATAGLVVQTWGIAALFRGAGALALVASIGFAALATWRGRRPSAGARPGPAGLSGAPAQ